MLKKIESERTEQTLRRQTEQLREFRDLQLDRARRLGALADLMMEFVRLSLVQHRENGLVLNVREFSSVLSSSTKAMELSMDTEAISLGVTEFLDRYLDFEN